MRIRSAKFKDLSGILEIYNQGIEERMATFDAELKDMDYIQKWFIERKGKYIVIVGVIEGKVIGWAAVGPYDHCYIYNKVGNLSIFVHRLHRNKGVGQKLLEKLEQIGQGMGYHKFVVFMFAYNINAQLLFEKNDYNKVGLYRNHALMGGQYVDITIMEKLFN